MLPLLAIRKPSLSSQNSDVTKSAPSENQLQTFTIFTVTHVLTLGSSHLGKLLWAQNLYWKHIFLEHLTMVEVNMLVLYFLVFHIEFTKMDKMFDIAHNLSWKSYVKCRISIGCKKIGLYKLRIPLQVLEFSQRKYQCM